MRLWRVLITHDDNVIKAYLYVDREKKSSESRVRTTIYHILWPGELYIRPTMNLIKCSKDVIHRLKTQHVLELAIGNELISVEH